MAENLKGKIEQDATITKSDGYYKRLATEFYYDKIELKDYSYCGDGHKLQIYALYDYDSDWHESMTPVKCKTPELLCAMLTLRGELPDNLFEPLRIKYRDSYIGNEELSLIIKWCIKNGFPLIPIFNKKPNAKFTFGLKSSVYFMVRDFINELNDIYNAYLLYRRIARQENIDPNSIYNEMPLDECKNLFENMYQKLSFANQISFNGEIHWKTKAKHLFDAAFYQLVILLNDPKKEVKECPLCHIFFEREHKNQVYCMNVNSKYQRTCYPQKKYKNKKSTKKSGQQIS